MCDCRQLSRRHFLGLTAALMASQLAGCGGGGGGGGPEAVRWGRENCAFCGMIIDDPRFAAEIRDPAGKLSKFDDIGCAITFLSRAGLTDNPAAAFWVSNSDAKQVAWMDGRTAWYLAGRKSPMAYDFGAVPARIGDAVDFAGFAKAVAAKGSTSRCEPSLRERG